MNTTKNINNFHGLNARTFELFPCPVSFSLKSGEEFNVQFNPDKIPDGERDFRGHKSPTVVHMVTIPEWGEVTPMEKEFSLSPKWNRDLRTQMIESGCTLFKVRRDGETAQDTKYTFEPIS